MSRELLKMSRQRSPWHAPQENGHGPGMDDKVLLNMFRESANRRVAEDLERFEYKLGISVPSNKDDLEKPRYDQKLREQIHEYFRYGVKPPPLLVRAANNAESLVPIVPSTSLKGQSLPSGIKFGETRSGRASPRSMTWRSRPGTSSLSGGARGQEEEEVLKLPSTVRPNRGGTGLTGLASIRTRAPPDPLTTSVQNRKPRSPFSAFGAASKAHLQPSPLTPSRFIDKALVGGATTAAEVHAKVNIMRLKNGSSRKWGSPTAGIIQGGTKTFPDDHKIEPVDSFANNKEEEDEEATIGTAATVPATDAANSLAEEPAAPEVETA
mmetsp:Transcript_24044/g.29106  ORF Transcript_24044/g.29106 Transcript_24044/m.29106 type:complete len:324 (-) Transcript_24044:890-1861(-)